MGNYARSVSTPTWIACSFNNKGKFETVESSLYLCSILLQKYFLSMWNFAGFGTDFAYCGLRSTDYKVPTKSQGQSRLYIQIALLIYFCMNEYNAGGVLEKD